MTRVDAPHALPSHALDRAAMSPGDHCDRYQLVQQVAQGGMASIWLARLRSAHGFERLVALKTILPSFAQEPKFRNMFLDEARIASRIDHANVAPIFDLGECDGMLYLVMEWIEGDSLTNLVRAAERSPSGFPLPLVLKIMAEACAGLHAAHELTDERGCLLDVVHRDVSPQNILVSAAGTVKVIDFGVAKARVRTAEETCIGTVKGKLHYMAPERALGLPVDRRADVWSVGAVLYRLLAGHAPYRGPDDRDVVNQLVSGASPEPLSPQLPASVRELVSKALAHDPRERYATAAALQRALEASLLELGATVTSHDIAQLIDAQLGDSLALRRFAANTAVERLDQSMTMRRARPVGLTSEDVILIAPSLPAAASAAQPVVQATPTPPGVFPALKRHAAWGARRSTVPRQAPIPVQDSEPSKWIQTLGARLREVGRRARHTLGAACFTIVGALGVLWVIASGVPPAALPSPTPPQLATLTTDSWRSQGLVQVHTALAPCPSVPSISVDDLALEPRPTFRARPPAKTKHRPWRPRTFSVPRAPQSERRLPAVATVGPRIARTSHLASPPSTLPVSSDAGLADNTPRAKATPRADNEKRYLLEPGF